ncbi:hypothetical protein TUM12151_06750 [Morganella morganii]|nr:hypothetical protein LR61_12835 [Morganella morganii]MQC07509.1 hypothetical protein [Morganella morganii]MQC10936.1 hypothetical protein [Morganella morganii]MQC15539.1 hypothetical protein [Morganella morganii]ROJ30299.1 hypothetical protein BFD15_13675 [Morganella morganii]
MRLSVPKGKQKNPFTIQGYLQNPEKNFLPEIKNRADRGEKSKKLSGGGKRQKYLSNYLI